MHHCKSQSLFYIQCNLDFLLFFFFSTLSADMFAHGDGGPEPEWVKTEREQFSDFRDLNKDGKMDADEIRHWIMPQDYDHAQAEARHLVYESDKDKVLRFTCVTSTSAAVHHVTDLAPSSVSRTRCWPKKRSSTTGTCLLEVRPPTMVKTSPGTMTSSELSVCVCLRGRVRERKDTCEDCEQHLSFSSHCWDRFQWN